jgi:hypothetical protein
MRAKEFLYALAALGLVFCVGCSDADSDEGESGPSESKDAVTLNNTNSVLVAAGGKTDGKCRGVALPSNPLGTDCSGYQAGCRVKLSQGQGPCYQCRCFDGDDEKCGEDEAGCSCTWQKMNGGGLFGPNDDCGNMCGTGQGCDNYNFTPATCVDCGSDYHL